MKIRSKQKQLKEFMFFVCGAARIGYETDSVFAFLLNKAVWENAKLLSSGELNSYACIHQVFIEYPPHARPWRKAEEESSKSGTLCPIKVQAGTRCQHL